MVVRLKVFGGIPLSASGLLLMLMVMMMMLSQVSSSGVFQLQLLHFINEGGLNASGRCCAGSRSSTPCSLPCRTHFQICLSHYQSSLPAEVTCTFGKVKTPSVGVNSIYNINNSTINIPFDFTWPGSFSLVLEALHGPSSKDVSPSHPGAPENLIYRVAIQGIMEAGVGWQLYENASNDLHLVAFRYRVTCNETYFGPGCSDTCQPRDDKFGHYACSATGVKICHSGWTGQYCDKAVCLDGCDPIHGYCDDPNECKCRLGWQGKLCRQCIPYPGCQHGSCEQPWQCNCYDGWGGLFCNQDLNFCTTYRPCRNGGTCTNAGQGSYACTCAPGFTGSNCEIEIEDCIRVPCQNGGTCMFQQQNGRYACTCPSNYYGSYCQWRMSKSCDLGPCRNNGTCSEHNGQYYCTCPSDYTGLNCETKLDACSSSPCLNEGRCMTRFDGTDFLCLCNEGYSGTYCQDDQNHCAGSPCLNGATCIPDISDGFICQCVPGYVGVLCQDDVDDCLNYPCTNHATCVDLVNDFRCICDPGFSGRYCNENVTSCLSNPCTRGATCVDTLTGYQCICPADFRGKHCDQRDVTLPLLVATQDKQIDGNVISGINVSQIVLIVVLGVLLPVAAVMAGVVFFAIKRRRRRKSRGEVNIRSNDLDDVNNWNRTKMADATEIKVDDVRTSRPLKITNKERQNEHERKRNIFTVERDYDLCDPEDKRHGVNHHLGSRDFVTSDCACSVHRTCSFHGSRSFGHVMEPEVEKMPPSAFAVRASTGLRPTMTESLDSLSSNSSIENTDSRHLQQHLGYVFATEV